MNLFPAITFKRSGREKIIKKKQKTKHKLQNTNFPRFTVSHPKQQVAFPNTVVVWFSL